MNMVQLDELFSVEAASEPRDSKAPRRLVVKRGSRRILVPLAEIDWIEAEGNYARLWVGSNSYLIRETMTRLEEKLRPAHFVRIQRSSIVNVDRIAEVRGNDGDFEVVLTTGKRLPLSRAYVANLDETLETA